MQDNEYKIHDTECNAYECKIKHLFSQSKYFVMFQNNNIRQMRMVYCALYNSNKKKFVMSN